MEEESTGGVVERAIAYVKDALGMPADAASPKERAPSEPMDAATSNSGDDSAKTALELNAESARREDGE